MGHKLHSCRQSSSQTGYYKLTCASRFLEVILLIFFLPLSHMLPYIGTGRLHLEKHCAEAAQSWNTCWPPIKVHIQLQILLATSSETLQVFNLGNKSKDGKPKITALNSLPHSFQWNEVFSPPCLNYVRDYKAFREQKVGKLTYVLWSYILGVHTGKETYSDYFLNPGTILCVQLGAVATGSSSQLVLWFATDFSHGLMKRLLS